ncbi:MAG: 4'-phosphopantetheinyl transferase superfamily protein [Acidimicrobiaceae bacterium]|nr:4'-phosphopantetheinyl transferase superfamily protein [Acidimicrobiaceae bacterium]
MRNQLSIYWTDIDIALPTMCRVLSATELERLHRFRNADDGKRFLVACATLRLLAASRLDVAPIEVHLDRSCSKCNKDHGKIRIPQLSESGDLSVSHSGQFISIAFVERGRVGIDVEQIASFYGDSTYDEILSSREMDILLESSNSQRWEILANIWTQKEAIAKATGLGHRFDFKSISAYSPKSRDRSSWENFGDGPTRVWKASLAAASGYRAAVAVLDEDPTNFIEQVVSDEVKDWFTKYGT